MDLVESKRSPEPDSGQACSVHDSIREAMPSSIERARRVAAIASAQAETIDRDGSFPVDALSAARELGLLSLLVPKDLGGEGASLAEVAEVCFILGQSCASTAMIVAMHHAALACVIRHHQDSAWHLRFLREVAAHGLLVASSTTEGAGGGNVRSSTAPLMREKGTVALDRAATVISYGAEADAIVTTARHDIDSATSMQALVVFTKSDYTLTKTVEWQTLGMRGTRSAGFSLKAKGREEQILPVGYDQIHTQTMVPASHLLWASVWAGVATAAVARGQSFIRTAARRAGGQLPPGAARFTRAVTLIQSLRARVGAAVADFESVKADPLALGSLDRQLSLNILKIEISDMAVDAVSTAMRVCGLAGYRTDGDFSIGRHLRDILSAPIMVHNDRISANIAATAVMGSVPNLLAG